MPTYGLKFLVDVGVGKKVEDFLYKSGYDVLPVRKINPSMSDSEIIGIAAKDNRIIITMDKDFGELVCNSGLIHKGILLLRTENCSGDKKIKIISEILGIIIIKMTETTKLDVYIHYNFNSLVAENIGEITPRWANGGIGRRARFRA